MSVGAIAAQVHDPTASSFCRHVTGSKRASSLRVHADACHGLVLAGVLDDFPNPHCAVNFCESGVVGLVVFLSAFFSWLHHYLGQLCAIVAGLFVVQLTQLCLSLALVCKGFADLRHRSYSGNRRANYSDPRGERRRRLVRGTDDSSGIALSDINTAFDTRTTSIADEDYTTERQKFRRKIQRQLAQEQP